MFEHVDRAQEGTFPRATRADNGNDLTLFNVKRDVPDSVIITVTNIHILQADNWLILGHISPRVDDGVLFLTFQRSSEGEATTSPKFHATGAYRAVVGRNRSVSGAETGAPWSAQSAAI